MNAKEIVSQITDRAGNIQGLLGQLDAALRDAVQQAKDYPDLTKKIAEAESRLREVTAEVNKAEAALEKAQAAKTKVLRELGAA